MPLLLTANLPPGAEGSEAMQVLNKLKIHYSVSEQTEVVTNFIVLQNALSSTEILPSTERYILESTAKFAPEKTGIVQDADRQNNNMEVKSSAKNSFSIQSILEKKPVAGGPTDNFKFSTVKQEPLSPLNAVVADSGSANLNFTEEEMRKTMNLLFTQVYPPALPMSTFFPAFFKDTEHSKKEQFVGGGGHHQIGPLPSPPLQLYPTFPLLPFADYAKVRVNEKAEGNGGREKTGDSKTVVPPQPIFPVPSLGKEAKAFSKGKFVGGGGHQRTGAVRKPVMKVNVNDASGTSGGREKKEDGEKKTEETPKGGPFDSHVKTTSVSGAECVCPVCNDIFTSKLFGGHWLAHPRCTICQMRFTSDRALHDHRRTHNRCNKCGASFTTIHSLNSHSKAFHAEVDFKCVDCNEKFINIHHLYSHRRQVHGILSVPRKRPLLQ